MKRILAVIVGLALALIGSVAVAAWLSSGSAAATGTATSVDKANKPDAVRGDGRVDLSWASSTLASGDAVAGYRVLRHDGANTTEVCITTMPSCIDFTPAAGPVTYGVVATIGANWSGPESATTAFTYDNVAPVTTATISPQPNTAAWNNTSVTVTLNASDALPSAGVDHIHYQVDSGTGVDVNDATASFPVSGAGTHTVTYYAVDKANNAESPQSQTVKIDPDSPLVSNLQPTSGASGTWAAMKCASGDGICADASDALSGVAISGVTYSLTATSGTNNGKCWNGTSFATPTCAQQPMSLVSGSRYAGSTSLSAASMASGSYTLVVKATDVAGNSATASSTFTVKADQTISFTSTAPGNATVGGSTYTVSATATSTLTVTFASATPSVCTIGNGSTVSFVGTGTCTINADQAGNATFNAAPQVQQSFAVKANQVITFNALSDRTFGDADFTVSATANSGLSVTFSSATSAVCTVSGNTVKIVTAGQCTISADQAGDATWNAAQTVQQSFTIAKANQTIDFTQPPTPAAAGTSATLSASATSGLTVAFSTTSAASICTVSGATVNYVGTGSCVITASQTGGTNYNAASPVPRTVAVTAPFAITDQSFANPQNTTTLSGTGGTSGATVSVYVCSGTQISCGAGSPNLVISASFTQPRTATVAANGTWSVIFSKLSGSAATFTAQAFQASPSKTSPVYTFTTLN